MINYANGKIYTIRCSDDDTLIYIGSTTQPLSKRWGEHKNNCLKQPNRLIYKTINNEWSKWYIELYEEYPCENREQLLKREGEIIRLTGNLNMCIAGRTDKEYYLDNIDKRNQYYIDNADKIKQREKQYYQDNIDKIKDYKKQYSIDNADKIREYKKQYYIDNADKQKEKQYYQDNIDKIKEKAKEYYQDNINNIKEKAKEYRIINADKIKVYMKEYRLKKKLEKQEIKEK